MRRFARVALALAIALPACAQRSAGHAGFSAHSGGFAARGAPSAMHAAPPPVSAFRAPQNFRSAPSFSGPQTFRSAPAFSRPQTFRGPMAPTGSRYSSGAPASSNGYSPIGIHPVPRPPVRYPHSYPFNPGNRPTFFNHNHDRIFFNQSFGLLAYPVFIGPGYWPYDLSYNGGYGPYNGFIDSPYNDPVYNNLSNDGLAPSALQSPAYNNDPGYYSPAQPEAAQPEPAPPAPQPPAPSPEMQYVPGSADTVTLIFRDGRPPEQIHNFLATRSTLIVTDTGHRREIPIASLDLAATLKANRETGVDFQLPSPDH